MACIRIILEDDNGVKWKKLKIESMNWEKALAVCTILRGVGAIPASGLAGTDRRVVGGSSSGESQRPKKELAYFRHC